MKFNVGDFVVMKKSANREYTYSKYKSTGIIESVDEAGRMVLIRFDEESLFDFRGAGETTWWIRVEHVKLTKQLTPQEKVLNKIKQMESRWKNFQQRKGSCYV